MKLTTLILITAILQVRASSFAQKITLSATKMPLSVVFREIRKQSGYDFVFSRKTLKDSKSVNINVNNLEIEALLEQLFADQPLDYQLNNKFIIISKKKAALTDAVYQQSTWLLNGIVTDSNNQPLVGVSIKIKDKVGGVVTDGKGKFSIQVAAGMVLVFGHMGFAVKEIVIKGQQTITVMLQNENLQLSEVTVTALGIKREKKALGYSVAEIKGEELQKAKETNLINTLAGKVPGLVISQTAGGPSGSTRVLIRGITELTGDNQPLYVVDGVPLDNTNFGSADTYGGFDLGDGISSINPDDVESISVLKGPAASALYGSRASHGVILITTKKASKGKKLGIEFNSTTTIDQQLTNYDVQTTYGQGSKGRITGDDDIYTSAQTWGPKIDPGLKMTYFDGVTRPYEFINNNINGFFRTGLTTTNTLILNSVQSNTGVRLSYTNMQNWDIVPNTDMSRNTLNLRATSKFAERLDMDMKINYVRESVNNRPALSGSMTNVGRNLMNLATTFDQNWLKNSYKTETGEYYNWNNNDIYNLNPYWVINEMMNQSSKDRVSGSGVFNYKLNNKIQARLTGGGEINFFNFMNYAPVSTPGKVTGSLEQSTIKNYTYNAELLISYKDKLGPLDIGANIGGNTFYADNRTSLVLATDMRMRETIALQSFLAKENTESAYRKQINSAFGMINLGYRDFLFLDATFRVDNSSTLPANNNTYFYPSVSGSFVFSELLKINKDILSFGKIRASVAQVGSDTGPFRLGLNYAMLDKPYLNYSQAYIFNSEIPNKNLKPARTNSAEFGVDLRFLNNRITLDATYYTQNSKDQILSLNTSLTSGYNSKIVNAGEIENKGIEIALGTRPIQTKDFSWDLNVNFAKNTNKVKALAEGLNRFSISRAEWLEVTVDAVVGEDYGAIMGRDYLRNENGDILINGNTGLPLISNDVKVLGNGAWDWTGGLSSKFQYKDFSLSTLFDVKVGADLYSMTARSLHSGGKAQGTLAGREDWYRSDEQRLEAGVTEANWVARGGYLVDGVIEKIDVNGNKTYTPNTKFVDPQDYWGHIAKNIPGRFIRDNSYVKIREITFSYKVPKKIVSRFADDVFVSLVARNPFIIYKNVDNIDPDSNYNNGMGIGLENGSLPSRRSYGFNIMVKF